MICNELRKKHCHVVNEHVWLCICGHSKYGSVDKSSTHDYAHWISLYVTTMQRQRVRASISDQASPRLMGVSVAEITSRIVGVDKRLLSGCLQNEKLFFDLVSTHS